MLQLEVVTRARLTPAQWTAAVMLIVLPVLWRYQRTSDFAGI